MLNILRFLGADDVGYAPWVIDTVKIVEIVIMSVLALLAVFMIVLVCMQKSETNGVSAISGQSDTFYNRNKKSTLQGKIKVLTIITAVLIMVLCIAFLILNSVFNIWSAQ